MVAEPERAELGCPFGCSSAHPTRREVGTVTLPLRDVPKHVRAIMPGRGALPDPTSRRVGNVAIWHLCAANGPAPNTHTSNQRAPLVVPSVSMGIPLDAGLGSLFSGNSGGVARVPE